MMKLLVYAVFIFDISCSGCESIGIVAKGLDNLPILSYNECNFMMRSTQSYWAIYKEKIVHVTCTVIGHFEVQAE